MLPNSCICMFNQQGLEKLNNLTTKHFPRASNHREYNALKQVLEKRNRLELLEMMVIEGQKGSICKLTGHNRLLVPLCETYVANFVSPPSSVH